MQTPRDSIKYRNDSQDNGYDYRNNIFKKTLSSAFFLDDTRTEILLKLEEIFYFLIESVKDLKKYTSWQQSSSNRNMN